VATAARVRQFILTQRMFQRILTWAADFDARLAMQANAVARTNSPLRMLVAVLAERLASVEVALMILLLVRGRRGSVANMVAAVALVYGLSEVSGRLGPRDRPFMRLSAVEALVEHSGGRSFPSRHVASGLAMASIARRAHPRLGALMAVIAAVLGLTRVAAGLHYPSDVLAGLGLGLLVGRLWR
jgi:membrane-associated phospholipid phosphatase